MGSLALKYSEDLKADASKTGNMKKLRLFEGWYSNGGTIRQPDRWSSFQIFGTKMIYHRPFEYQTSPLFRWLLYVNKIAAKNSMMDIYVRFSNDICKLAYFPPFEMGTLADFRSLL